MISATTISPLNRRIIDEGAPPFSFGNALEFDGANDYVTGYTLNSNISTISFWFYATANSNRRILSSINSTSETLRLNGTSLISFTTTIFSGVNLNQWNHFIYCSNNGALTKAFLNSNKTTHSTTFGASQIGLGAKTALSFGNNFEGKIDEFAIKENYILSDSEAAQLWNNGNGNNFNNIVGSSDIYWQFNQTSPDSTANDSSGNGNVGTLNNFDTATCWVAH